MAWIFLLTNLAVIVLSVAARYGPGPRSHAWPFAASPPGFVAAFVAAALLVFVAILVLRVVRNRSRRGPMLELMGIFPVFFAFEWLVLPPYRWRAIDWFVMAALLGAIGLMMYRDRRRRRQWGVGAANFTAAVKLLALPTAVMVAGPILLAIRVGTDFQASRAAEAMLYPVYALGQMLVFQVFLVQRLRRISDSRAAIVLVSAGVFALLHWPNGPVMIGCFIGAIVWTWVYLARPNVFALALSMGISAAVFANALPRDFTQNMRTGPIYVQRILDAEATPAADVVPHRR